MKTLFTLIINLILFNLNSVFGNTCSDAVQANNGNNFSDYSQDNNIYYKYTSTRDGIIKLTYDSDLKGNLLLGPILKNVCSEDYLSDNFYVIDNRTMSIITRKGQTYFWRSTKVNLAGVPEQYNWTLTEEDPETIDVGTFTIQTNLSYKLYRYQAKQDGFLYIKASGSFGVNGNYIIGISNYDRGTLFIIDDTYKENSIYFDCKKDSIYYLRFENNLDGTVPDANVVTITFDEQSIPQESTCENALTAQPGTNSTTFNQLREVWYKYTSQVDTILNISISAQIPFQIGNFKINSCGNPLLSDYYKSYYSKDYSTLSVLIYAQKNQTYFWQFKMNERENPSGSYSWNLSKQPLEYAWSAAIARYIQKDTLELPKNLNYTAFYKYKAKTNGVLSLKGSVVPRDVELQFGIKHNDKSVSNDIFGPDEDVLNLECKKDSIYYLTVYANDRQSTENGSVRVIIREVSPAGTTCELAYKVEKGETVTTSFDPFYIQWYKYTATRDGIIRINYLTNPVSGIYPGDGVFVGSCNKGLNVAYYFYPLIYARKGVTYYWYFNIDYYRSIYKPFNWNVIEEDQTFGWSDSTAMPIDVGLYTYTHPNSGLEAIRVFKYKAKTNGRIILKISGNITSNGNFTVSLKDSANGNWLSQSVDKNLQNIKYFRNCKKDSIYYIYIINNISENETVTVELTDRELIPGESANNPIYAVEGMNTSDHENMYNNDVFFKYIFTRKDSIEISYNGSENTSAKVFDSKGNANSDNGKKTLFVSGNKNDTILIIWSGYNTRGTYQWKLKSLIEKPKYVEILNNEVLSVYPNPVEDNMFIKIKDNSEAFLVEIYTLSGQKVVTRQFSNSSEIIKVNTKDLNSGQYILVVKTGRNKEAIKFLKK